jgi:hypothetical protein
VRRRPQRTRVEGSAVARPPLEKARARRHSAP